MVMHECNSMHALYNVKNIFYIITSNFFFFNVSCILEANSWSHLHNYHPSRSNNTPRGPFVAVAMGMPLVSMATEMKYLSQKLLWQKKTLIDGELFCSNKHEQFISQCPI